MKTTHDAKADDISRLVELTRDIRVAMLTTFPSGRPPHARPMYTTGLEAETFDGVLWFMSGADSVKNDELRQNPDVLLTYAAPESNRYVAVYGTARVEKNPDKARELWNVHAKAWFPEGPDDPNLTLIAVTVQSAEYWDGPSHVSYLLHLLKAVATGNPPEVSGQHGRVEAGSS